MSVPTRQRSLGKPSGLPPSRETRAGVFWPVCTPVRGWRRGSRDPSEPGIPRKHLDSGRGPGSHHHSTWGRKGHQPEAEPATESASTPHLFVRSFIHSFIHQTLSRGPVCWAPGIQGQNGHMSFCLLGLKTHVSGRGQVPAALARPCFLLLLCCLLGLSFVAGPVCLCSAASRKD